MKTRFLELDALLLHYEPLWKPSAFTQLNDHRLDDFPEIAQWLSTLSDKEIDTLQMSDEALLTSSQRYFSDASKLLSLITFPKKDSIHTECVSPFWNQDIPGRKAEQIRLFSSSLMPFNQPVIEWCCGKQHLGRYIAETNDQHVTGLEIDTRLVSQSRILANKRKLSNKVTTIECDVLDSRARDFVNSERHLVALHACGGLHTKMLDLGINRHSNRISFSPCCYHRFNMNDIYQPLSLEGKHSKLTLSTEDLRLATRQCNTASASETRNRKQLQAWRLGFDKLQRTIRDIDEYLPSPSLSKKVLKNGFKHFCQELARIKGLRLPDTIDYEDYEQIGAQHFERYQRIELARMLFRRSLETWLVLDRVLLLEEHDYRCTVSEFCESSTTPRNFLIDAWLKN
jgi:hypothetical protein